MTSKFTTIEQGLAACEAEGLEPRIEHGGIEDTRFWIYFDGGYHCYWGEEQFLGWCNASIPFAEE